MQSFSHLTNKFILDRCFNFPQAKINLPYFWQKGIIRDYSGLIIPDRIYNMPLFYKPIRHINKNLFST